MNASWNALRILLFVHVVEYCRCMCSYEYGRAPCSYVPAPPGKTPPCARPGFTYCENPDHYPSHLIHHLVQKWKFNHQSLIIDEAKDEFTAYYYPPPPTIYGSPQYIPNHVNNDEGYHYPEPIYISKPQHTFPEQGGFYIPPKVFPPTNFTLGFNDQSGKDGGTFLTYKYTGNFPLPQGTKNHYSTVPYQPPVFPSQTTAYSPINELWKRNERGKRSLRRRRRFSLNTNLNSTSLSLARNKRQSTVTGQTLCRSRSNFIMPRAALNSKGNWMYVVNMPEVDSRYTQLVKSETCVDQNCNGLCTLPQGYSSRCEQKYVQKRLIALDGSGGDLYSDTFWFPSCCVCTISNT
ncbi:protein spaetzle 5 isoform X2 [Cylas formicarius]|uniref:protein spaetzle 5 isoform X2 n=1 Tax=Cylas formicarius TaxID=197179 RepID=UPI002958DF1C|nr:protein spaetzle 5 isoform X2 [Cylas formicarius]